MPMVFMSPKIIINSSSTHLACLFHIRYAKEGHVPSYIAATSSSCQQADAVAQDTEVLPPSGSCLSSSPASHVWARHVKDWGIIFYIRVDLQGSFHTYPNVGGPFQSSQETDKAIDRYLEDHRDPKM